MCGQRCAFDFRGLPAARRRRCTPGARGRSPRHSLLRKSESRWFWPARSAVVDGTNRAVEGKRPGRPADGSSALDSPKREVNKDSDSFKFLLRMCQDLQSDQYELYNSLKRIKVQFVMAATVALLASRSMRSSSQESFILKRASDASDSRRLPERDSWEGCHDVEILMLDG